MLFNSVEFLFIFFPFVFTIYFILKKYLIKFVSIFIAFTSLFFYAYWNLGFSLLLLLSITINFYAAKLIQLKLKNALIFVYIVLFYNLGLLIFFKYTNFLIDNINMAVGFEAVSHLNILLPLGISFYTFTQSSYIWDVYKGEKVEESYINYLIFVSFFPHLIAGPLIHHKELFIQLKELNSKFICQNSVYIGMVIFIIGLAKKILLADNFSKFSNYLFNNLNHVVNPNVFLSWIGSISYSLQLYFDFSGYSDMAVGLGLIFGIILPINFNDPYKKLSIIAFWKSWHISLTKYINEYLYTPIALYISRKYYLRESNYYYFLNLVIPTIITMVIVGIWHGANYTFLLFGIMHAFYLIINHYWINYKISKKIYIPDFIYWTITYLSVLIAQIMFRADNINDALIIYKGLISFTSEFYSQFNKIDIDFIRFGLWGLEWGQPSMLEFFKLLLLSILIIKYLPSTQNILNASKEKFNQVACASFSLVKLRFDSLYFIIILLIIYVLSIRNLGENSEFLYFQF